MKRLFQFNLVLVLVAAVAVLLWIRAAGGFDGLSGLRAAGLFPIAGMLALTGASVLIRFLRWQFLMRHAGCRVPERQSLRIYLASLVGTATPAYVAEAIRCALLRRQFGVSLRVSLFVLVVERLMDVIALALIAGIVVAAWWMRGTMLAIGVGGIFLIVVATWLGRALGVAPAALGVVRRADVLFDAAVLSVTAWALTAFHVTLAGASLGLWIAPLEGARVITSSVLLGGLTLMPAGIGATGGLAILQLQDGGTVLAQAVMVVALVRLTTVGATLLAGSIALLSLLRAPKEGYAGDAAVHFDEIATEYGDQWRPHVWRHLLEKKVGLITSALPPPSAAGLGLDLGCGLGSQCLALASRGYRVVGMEIAAGLAVQARRAGASVAAGSALALPFRDQSLDFVYAVGVLHHLPDRKAQRLAYQEIGRVLKPGGRLVVHETNTRNPLFRLYMGYVFPLLKKIDEGTEWWIEPDRWETVLGLRPVSVKHFTFMPDFVPSWLMSQVLAIDRWLENSRLRSYSVHYMAVLERDPSWVPANIDPRFRDEAPPVDGSWSIANQANR